MKLLKVWAPVSVAAMRPPQVGSLRDASTG
jgi:hypothetical protein